MLSTIALSSTIMRLFTDQRMTDSIMVHVLFVIHCLGVAIALALWATFTVMAACCVMLTVTHFMGYGFTWHSCRLCSPSPDIFFGYSGFHHRGAAVV